MIENQNAYMLHNCGFLSGALSQSRRPFELPMDAKLSFTYLIVVTHES